ncbi:hypothetical protein V6N13_100343 [Hibiscus sabdariffa]
MLIVWSGIVNNWKDPDVSRWMSIQSFRWQVGDGRYALFWEDLWCGERPLRTAFNKLYRLARNKGVVVADVAVFNGLQVVKWEFLFSRPLLDREKQMVADLELFLSKVRLFSDVPDSQEWGLYWHFEWWMTVGAAVDWHLGSLSHSSDTLLISKLF